MEAHTQALRQHSQVLESHIQVVRADTSSREAQMQVQRADIESRAALAYALQLHGERMLDFTATMNRFAGFNSSREVPPIDQLTAAASRMLQAGELMAEASRSTGT